MLEVRLNSKSTMFSVYQSFGCHPIIGHPSHFIKMPTDQRNLFKLYLKHEKKKTKYRSKQENSAATILNATN